MTESCRKQAVPLRVSQRAKEAQPTAGPAEDLHGEITLLRAAIHQLSARAGAVESLAEQLRVLDGLGRASVRLANLLRAQRALEEEQTAAALSRALDEVNRKRRNGHP